MENQGKSKGLAGRQQKNRNAGPSRPGSETRRGFADVRTGPGPLTTGGKGARNGIGNSSSYSRDPGSSAFGFSRLYSLCTTPPDKTILFIDKDLPAWKQLLSSDDLKPDVLFLLVNIIGDNICAEVSLQQQQLNILSACCQSRPFIQKLMNLVMEIMIGSYKPASAQLKDVGKERRVIHSANSLLKNLYQFSSTIFKLMPRLTQDNTDLKAIISLGIQAAAKSGDPNLIKEFTVLWSKIEEMTKQKQAKMEATKRQKREGFTKEDYVGFDKEIPPEHIRDIVVIPTIQELKDKQQDIFLRPNKPSGAYIDSEHYCDVQFRLFREDFVQPLREGVKEFLKNKTEYLKKGRMPPGELRLYKGVRFIKVTKEFDTLVHKLQLSPQNYQRIRWNTSKRLLYGALVMLTTEEKSFQKENTHFGVIFSRNISDLEKGIVTLTWEGYPPNYTANEYLMFESEVYLESRIHTLETLKKLNLDTFPMKRFIVDAESDVDAPSYMEGEDKKLIVGLANGQKRSISPLKEDEWPEAAEFGLDENQFFAFHAALTKKFAIIQGPPGTGKTFLGLKIAEVLLHNQGLWRGTGEDEESRNPITVVCFTNFALDQFLEGIVRLYEKQNMQPNILRLGGSSKSEIMKEFTLQKMRSQKRLKRPRIIYEAEREARANIDQLEESRALWMDQVIGLQNLEGIVNFEKLCVLNKQLTLSCPKVLLDQFRKLYWFGVNPGNINRPDFRPEGWIRKYFRVTIGPESFFSSRNIQANIVDNYEYMEEVELYEQDEIVGDRIFEDIMLEAETCAVKPPRNSVWSKDIYLPWLSISAFDAEIESLGKPEAEGTNKKGKKKEKQKQKMDQNGNRQVIENRRAIFLRMFDLYQRRYLDLPDVTQLLERIRKGDLPQAELEKLTISQKWAIYFAIVEEFRAAIANKVADAERRLTIAKRELANIMEWGDSYIARDCRVVGLTTTGAAKYNNLLRQIKSKIVIVEEAAQVFEAQVVTCITQSCEHLIMIGDHKQLQPNPNVYELKKMYNLSLSLFERMLNNNLHCYQLKVQHRMRPEIADLIVGPIYDELLNAESVSDPDLYPDVIGVAKNVFFITHSEPEYCDNDSRSRSNMHEMAFISGLCRYLILQGYSSSQISVITTYKGQMFNLRSELRNIPTCAKVRVSSVDDFQGQENDIILVSLVRSNEEGKVGFVGIDNRICVALSRAKQGLFVIGNMEAMVSQSKTWAQIKEKLDTNGFIGQELELVCQVHGNRSLVKCGRDFLENSPEGGCTEVCNVVLPCSHICERMCHALDKEPEQHKCRKPCLRTCANKLHPCQGLCYQDPCPNCEEIVEKTLKCEFQHKVKMECHLKVEDVICMRLVSRIPVCMNPKHEVELACSKNIAEYKCQFTVTKILDCGHPKEMKCFEDPSTKQCKVLVTQQIPNCGHFQEEPCFRWNNPEHISCAFIVDKTLPLCEHTVKVKCSDKDKEVPCPETCALRLPCGHACKKKCHADKDPNHLTVKCKRPCTRRCPKNHKCPYVANHYCFQSDKCPPCMKTIEEVLSCGHKKKLLCYQFTEKSYKCMEQCTKSLQCRHPCKKMCFDTCEPCKVEVPKIAPCHHSQNVCCSEPAKKENCMELVAPRFAPACGHSGIKFPCKLEFAFGEELAPHCTKPCEHIFISGDETGCKHVCKGTCGSCQHGRLHLKCQEKCGRTLVCGHRCEVNCSKACPPCQKSIQVKCSHSTWKGLCGDLWPECVEPCQWNCKHKQCTRVCGEPCDRDPCNEPCENMLPCGHNCIGFCGEPCPTKCRICDRQELEDEMEILAVDDDIETARFVLLEDCPNGHCIEVNALQNLLAKDASDEIGLKACYIHFTPIINCRRFGKMIHQSYQDVLAVKKKAHGNLELSQILQTKWIKQFSQGNSPVSELFPGICQSIWKMLVNEAPLENGNTVVKPKELGEGTMKSLDFIAQCVAKPVQELLDLQRANKLGKPQFQQIVTKLGMIFVGMLGRHPLNYQEMSDFNGELDRVDFHKQLLLRRSLPQCNARGNEQAYATYMEAKKLLTSVLPLNHLRKEMFFKLLKELDQQLSSGLGITERERQQIVTAMGMSQGHWFKCPNGHIYAIGDCGGANQRGTCNICKQPIGGMSYRLERGNQFAREMDNATAPAWPTMQ